MTANVDPIFSKGGDLSANNGTTMAATLTTAAADFTGVSTNNVLVFTGGTNGGFIQRLRFKAIGTNAGTVARVYINNGSVHTTAANNSFYGEVGLPATTASTTSPTPDIDYPMNFPINAAFAVYVGLGATVAAGWVVVPVAGQY